MDSANIGGPATIRDGSDSDIPLSAEIARRATANIATRLGGVRRMTFPPSEIVEAAEDEQSPFHLAEAAATASAQLQQQINLMAQVMAIQSVAPAVTAATFPLFATASIAQLPVMNSNVNTTPNVGLPNVLDQYISAAAANSQQQQHFPSVPLVPATVANFSVPLAAYLHAAQQQQPSAIQPQQSNNAPLARQHSATNNTTMSSNQLYNSLLSALCPCTVTPLSPTTVCPYHSQQRSDGNNNNGQAITNEQMAVSDNLDAATATHLFQPSVLVASSQQSDGSRRQSTAGGIIQQHHSSAVATVAPLTVSSTAQSNRSSRSSLKRSTGIVSASANAESINSSASSPASQAVFINPGATSIRLSSQQQGTNNGIGEGPSRGPKLRRLASFDAFTNDEVAQAPISGQVSATEVAEFHAEPSVTSLASNAATNATAAAFLQMQQQAVAASIPSAATILSMAAASAVPTATTVNNSSRFLQHPILSVASSLPPPSTVSDQSSVSALSALGPAATAASISAGVEQIVAAALNAASAANAALSPQTVAAMVAATYPQVATSQCAVCAAAACQSRMGTPMASAVTACSCLHHHHHHLHCHHNAILSTPLPPICTLCNSNVVGGSSAASSPSTTTMAQPHQHLQSSSAIQQAHHQHQSNSNCIADAAIASYVNSTGVRMGAGSSSMGQSATSQVAPIAQRYLLNPTVIGDANNNNAGSTVTNNVSTNVNIQANAGGGSSAAAAAAAAAAALSPSAVTAMLLNSATAMSQQQPTVAQFVHTAHQSPMSSLYSFQRNATVSDFIASHQQQQANMSSMQQSMLASRLVQQERERDAANHFYQQQQQRAAALNAINASASPQHHLMRPLIMVPRLPAQMDLANVLLLHHPGTVGADAATLVLNGGANAASALAHAANPHHIVANAMATAAAPEPQPVGVSLDQIKKHSQKLSYVKDMDVPEQERDRCTVCLADFETGDELRALKCTHLFHTECIDRWLQYNKKCPVCRVDMDKGGAGSSAAAAEAAVMLNAYAAAAAASATSSTTTC